MERLYVLVRSDLTPGMKVAQSCHAMAAFAADHPSVTALWHTEGNNLVCLEVSSEDELLEIAERARQIGALTSLFAEPDLGGQFTAAAISGEAKGLLRRYPLAFRQAA